MKLLLFHLCLSVGVRDGYLYVAYAVFSPIFTWMCTVYMDDMFCVLGKMSGERNREGEGKQKC